MLQENQACRMRHDEETAHVEFRLNQRMPITAQLYTEGQRLKRPIKKSYFSNQFQEQHDS